MAKQQSSTRRAAAAAHPDRRKSLNPLQCLEEAQRLLATGQCDAAEPLLASLLALPLLPIIHFSVQRWRGVHPTVITGRGAGLHPDMQPALVLGFVLFTALVALLILTRARLERLREELRDLHVEAARLGLTEDDR